VPKSMSTRCTRDKRKNLGIMLNLWWHIWKEMNRSIFENKEQSVPRLVAMLQNDLDLLYQATVMVYLSYCALFYLGFQHAHSLY
jgi:hypothetical protein